MRDTNIYRKARYSLDECPSSDPCKSCIVGMTCVEKCVSKVKYDIKIRLQKKPKFKLKMRKRRKR